MAKYIVLITVLAQVKFNKVARYFERILDCKSTQDVV